MRYPILSSALLIVLILTATIAFAEVTVVTDKDTYYVGEIVHVSIHNSGPTDLEFNSAPFVAIRNRDTNTCVFGCTGLPVMTPFPAGTTVAEAWDTGVIPDPPGHYEVTVNILGMTVATEYLLTDAVGVEASSWGAVKALFRD